MRGGKNMKDKDNKRKLSKLMRMQAGDFTMASWAGPT